MKLLSTFRFLAGLLVMMMLVAGCGEGLGSKFSKAAKRKKDKKHFEIFQPNVDYPNDKVLIWTGPGRKKRKFQLQPGTRVKVLKTVNGATYDEGCEWDMYKIKTQDGREGWVPSNWCREKKGP